MERAAPTPTDHDPAPRAEAPAPMAAPVTLFVCITCGAQPGDAPGAGEALCAAVAEAVSGEDAVTVSPVRCLSNCKRALSAAITRADGWSYVFGDLSGQSAADLATGARLLSASDDGLMPWRGRPESLKRGMVARLPPLPGTPVAGPPSVNAQERS